MMDKSCIKAARIQKSRKGVVPVVLTEYQSTSKNGKPRKWSSKKAIPKKDNGSFEVYAHSLGETEYQTLYENKSFLTSAIKDLDLDGGDPSAVFDTMDVTDGLAGKPHFWLSGGHAASVSLYQSRLNIDIRHWYTTLDEEVKPTSMGISMPHLTALSFINAKNYAYLMEEDL